MHLPKISWLEKKEKPDYYLSLIFADENVHAIIFETLAGKIRIAGESEKTLEQNLEDLSFEELLFVCDKVIAKAESFLPPEIETKKTIFGLKENWIKNAKIKPEYLAKLKKISNQLELTPMGFLSITEVIANLLHKEEGAPLTAILADVGKKNITATLIKAGRILETKSSTIHESIPFTVDILLKHFQVPDVLPSRIIISTDDEELTQSFISHQWSRSLSFLHLPQIDSFPLRTTTKAMLYGVANQMNFEVAQAFIAQIKKEEVIEDEEEFTEVPKGKETEQMKEDDTQITADNFGFVEEVDIAKQEKKEEEKEEEPRIFEGKLNKIDYEEIEAKSGEDYFPTKTTKKQFNTNEVLNRFAEFLNNLSLPKNFGSGNKKFYALTTFVVILVLGGIYFYFFGTTANIVLEVKPQVIDQSKEVTFSTSGRSDFANSILDSEIISVSEKGSFSTDTTGKKETGTKAKGTITLYSRITEDTTFSSGLVIKSSNDLEYTLDNGVKIASASADASADPKTANVSVAAKNLGKEYNLPSGTKFSVSDYPSEEVIAKNENPFSGGEKKEIKIVAKEDMDKLLKEIVKNLQDKAKTDLAEKVTSGKSLLSGIVNSSISQKDFNKDVGDQTTQLTLSGQVSYEGIAYKNSDLTELVKAGLKNSSLDKLTVDEKTLKTAVSSVKKKSDGEYSASLKIHALLLPEINKADLAKTIMGISADDAKEKLSKINHVVNVNVSISPSIPFLPKILPRNSGNIKISVKSNG